MKKRKNKKCIFSSFCQNYKISVGCCMDDDNAANYYGPGRAAGCYRNWLDLRRFLCPRGMY